MARPNKYFTHVKPRLKEIEKLALTMTEDQICQCLGVGKSAWYEYKRRYSELAESLKKGREDLVNQLRGTLITAASGYHYTETKEIKKRNPDTGVMEVAQIESYKKYSKPDIAALNLLLKNYDKENWANDPQALALRREELELQKQKVEDSNWTAVV